MVFIYNMSEIDIIATRLPYASIFVKHPLHLLIPYRKH